MENTQNGEEPFKEDPPPMYSNYQGPSTSMNNPPQAEVSPVRPDELPPPYMPPSPQSGLTINCKVCQSIVSIAGKQNQRVVKCDVCNEVTPINAPAPGKRFVRCPCNCLLICGASELKVICPRANCNRVINLEGPALNTCINRWQCIHCGALFYFTVTRTALAKCPSCQRVSSVERSYVRSRMIIFLVLGLVFLAAGTGVTVGTYEMASTTGGIYTVWIDFTTRIMFGRKQLI